MEDMPKAISRLLCTSGPGLSRKWRPEHCQQDEFLPQYWPSSHHIPANQLRGPTVKR